ncbi:MAG: hypothetical protein JST54_05540 [Deltaproteobacteria bacterium]|nr:hypothetical protein [Deltaproteobacteria bacterium]
MLDGATGRLSLPSGFVVGPDTTLAHFKADAAYASARETVQAKSFTICSIDGGLHQGREVLTSLYFDGQALRSVKLTFSSPLSSPAWREPPAEFAATKGVHDTLLALWLGRPHAKRDGDLQYLLAWGEVWSCIDPRAGDAAITVRYR